MQLLKANPEVPSLLILCVNCLARIGSRSDICRCVTVHPDSATPFGHRPNISQNLASRLFRQFGLHGGFAPSLLGRASNLAPFAQVRTDPSEQSEVFGTIFSLCMKRSVYEPSSATNTMSRKTSTVNIQDGIARIGTTRTRRKVVWHLARST